MNAQRVRTHLLMPVVGLIRGRGGRRGPGGRPAVPARVPGGEPAVGGGAALPLLRAVLQVVLGGLPRGRGEAMGRYLLARLCL